MPPTPSDKRASPLEGTEWDLVVIGGGSAGLTASRTAAGLGATVLLVERAQLGGDCLWTGCVPSKALIAAAQRTATVHSAGYTEVVGSDSAFQDGRASVQRAIQAIMPADSREALEAENVTVMTGEARFTSERALSIGNTVVRFRQALIATGTTPVLPTIAGDAVRMRTSDSFWDLSDLPERLVVLGGGTVGCELGQAMARLSSRVSIIHGGARILPKEEASASRVVRDAMRHDGVDVRPGRTAVAVRSHDGESGVLSLDDGTTVDFDVLVAAVGRAPHTDALGLQSARVRTDANGYIAVDGSLRTTNPRIWAAGDVTGLPEFTHIAGVNGNVAATNAILGLRRNAETRVIPRVTFTAPEVAAVGVQASGVRRRSDRVVTSDHAHSDRAIAEGDTVGYTRIIVDRRGRILGGTIVGPRAGETLGELSLAVQARLTTSAVAATTHAYPTHSDPLWTAAVADVRHRLGRGTIARVIRGLRRMRRRRLT